MQCVYVVHMYISVCSMRMYACTWVRAHVNDSECLFVTMYLCCCISSARFSLSSQVMLSSAIIFSVSCKTKQLTAQLTKHYLLYLQLL